MKKVSVLFIAALSAVLFQACEGKPVGPGTTPGGGNDARKLELTADKYASAIGDEGEVCFTVTLGDEDVTSDALIFYAEGQELERPVFSTGAAGKYNFYATYKLDKTTFTSEEITVSYSDTSFDPTKEIHKRVAFFTFTATWCGPCAVFKEGMKEVLKTKGENIVQMNVHPSDGNDAIGCHYTIDNGVEQMERTGRFGVGAFPTTVVDFQRSTAGGGENAINSLCDGLINYIPKTGMMVSSTIVDNNLIVTVNVGAKEEGQYNLGIFLTEDHVMAPQTGYYNGGSYDHTNVGRQMGASNIFGDSLGEMEVGQTIGKTFSFEMMPKYKNENLNLLVYTLCGKDDYFGSHATQMVIDNAIKVPVNTTTGYNYLE